MHWNVVVTVQGRNYKKVREYLYTYGVVNHTDYLNVLVLTVDDITLFIQDLTADLSTNPIMLDALGRVMPVTETFSYQTVGEFEHKAKTVASTWLTAIAGKRFHVRMHRRGFKGRLSSIEEERFLDDFIQDNLEKENLPKAKIDFTDPELIIAIETIGQQAGLSIWNKQQLDQYPFLKLD